MWNYRAKNTSGSRGSDSGGSRGSNNNRYANQYEDDNNSYSNCRSQTASNSGGSNAEGRSINQLLLGVLREKTINGHALVSIIDTYIDRMDYVNIATLLFHSGKRKIVLPTTFICRITNRLKVITEELRAREASNALYGLKCMSSDTPEVRDLLSALADKLRHTRGEFNAQAIGNILYGCQNLKSEYREVRELIRVIAVRVNECTEPLEAQNVGNALYGLRGMSSDYAEIRDLIAILTPKVTSCREELNGQALGNSLYGLHNISSVHPEVQGLLTALARKAANISDQLKAQEVGNALYGLRRMNSEHAPVQMLLDALVPKISLSRDSLDSQAFGNAFYGMQLMKDNNRSVISLVQVMSEKLKYSSAELDGQAIGNCLYGLQNMTCNDALTRECLMNLTLKIESSTCDLNAQEISNALFGVQNVVMHEDMNRLVSALNMKLASCKHSLGGQELGNALLGTVNMSCKWVPVRVLLTTLYDKFKHSDSMFEPQSISNSLFALHRKSCEHDIVRSLCAILAHKIDNSWKIMTAAQVRTSIYSMNSLTSTPEVLSLIRSLITKVVSSRDNFLMRYISFSFFGLRNQVECTETKAMLAALTDKFRKSTDVFKFHDLALILFGIQGFGDCLEIRKLLSSIIDRIPTIVDDYTCSLLGYCFYGLQRMSTSCYEAKLIYAFLTSLLTKQNVLEYNPTDVGNTFVGISSCTVSDRIICSVLLSLITRSKALVEFYEANIYNFHLYDDVLTLLQAISIGIACLSDIPSEQYDELSQLQERLLKLFTTMKSASTTAKLVGPSGIFAYLINLIAAAKLPLVTITNDYLYGFEANLIIQSTIDPTIIVSVEPHRRWTRPCDDLYFEIRKKCIQHFSKGTVQIFSIDENVIKSSKVIGDIVHAYPDLFRVLLGNNIHNYNLTQLVPLSYEMDHVYNSIFSEDNISIDAHQRSNDDKVSTRGRFGWYHDFPLILSSGKEPTLYSVSPNEVFSNRVTIDLPISADDSKVIRRNILSSNNGIDYLSDTGSVCTPVNSIGDSDTAYTTASSRSMASPMKSNSGDTRDAALSESVHSNALSELSVYKEFAGDDSDDKVALIEAQLKVARLEAELLELKNKAKSK